MLDPKSANPHNGLGNVLQDQGKLAEAERAELRKRERLRLREMETLLAVSRAQGSTLDPTETMRRVARDIGQPAGTRGIRA